MAILILLRHGQSTWNLENRFTGWVDVDITDQGIQEAKRSGRLMKEAGLVPNVAFTSLLKRTITTLDLALAEMDLSWIPVVKHWRLNERHYGALQGLNKAETVEKYGKEQVRIWRRSYDIPPPPLDVADPNHPRFDLRYQSIPEELMPAAECLKDVTDRMMPFWYDFVVSELGVGKTVLVSAHGNSLRAMVKHLERLSDEEITRYEIPNAEPIVYELDKTYRVVSKEII